MNEIQVFNNSEFGQIRTMIIDGEPWFVGKDVAVALGYLDTKDAVRKHVDSEDKQLIQRRQIATLKIPNRGIIAVNESGLYALIFESKLPSAKRFKRWVTSEVLPAIRKTGIYRMEEKASVLPTPKRQEQKLIESDERTLAYNRGIVLGVLRSELEEDSALEIYERLSARGKGIVMKLIFGEVAHVQ